MSTGNKKYITVVRADLAQLLSGKNYVMLYLMNVFYVCSNICCSRGIIQPSTIGEDGRPVPVEHVLQLTENIPDPEGNTHESD